MPWRILGANVTDLVGVDVFSLPQGDNFMHRQQVGTCWNIGGNTVSGSDTLGICGISYRVTPHFAPQKLTAVSSATMWALYLRVR